ncbi:MAG: hypothetical protein EAZ51_04135 [Sphingobacteriales bacterium]|nr:MAG: hypothetical protein EAZ64_08160 [Sphingobacteriales bacterium]TAF81465.1 MAG: hypothetical protein EAZ51_04135 [Sphingobacteriales bacterium]
MTLPQKKILNRCIKIAVLLLATYFIYNKLCTSKNLESFFSMIKKIAPSQVYTQLAIIFLLMLLNWFLESLKWRYILKKVEPISLLKAIESVFCGLTWAIFTPNRIGEYGGRVFFLSYRKRIQGMVAMGVGHIAQMVITSIMGAVGVVWFIFNHSHIQHWMLPYFAFWGSVISVCLLIFYFNFKWLNFLLCKVKGLKKYQKYFGVLTRYNKNQLFFILLYSLARYIVFTSQYLIILHFLIHDLPFYPSALMVFILFLIQSSLPSLDLWDVGVRTYTATYFFNFITPHQAVVIACTALIWLVNLIIPAILGSFFIFKLNFFGSSRT